MIQRGLQSFVLEKDTQKVLEYIRTSASQLGMLDSVITAYQYDPKNVIALLRKYLSESDKREENNRIQKQHNSLRVVNDFIENAILNKKIEVIAGFKGNKEGYIMGVPVFELLSEEQEERMKLKLIRDLIRFNNKGEK